MPGAQKKSQFSSSVSYHYEEQHNRLGGYSTLLRKDMLLSEQKMVSLSHVGNCQLHQLERSFHK